MSVGGLVPERNRYRKPPVIEALCEVYFTASRWDDTVPGMFYERVRARFPERRQVDAVDGEGSKSGGAAGLRKGLPRVHFVNPSGDRLIQLARDLVVVNQLHPYPHFEAWEPDIYLAVNTYAEVAAPQGTARVGVRYINRIAIPEARVTMEDYFTIYPQVPKLMGDEHGDFMIRFEVPFHEAEGHRVVVTFATAQSESPNEIAFLLDLYDIVDTRASSELDKVASHVHTAHSAVERAFEGSITDRLRALFQLEE